MLNYAVHGIIIGNNDMERKNNSINKLAKRLSIISATIIVIALIPILFYFLKTKNEDSPNLDNQTSREASLETYNEITVKPVATKEELLAEVNRRRNDAGLNSLQYSAELDVSAQQKCNDMLNRHYYGHQDPDGKNGIQIAFESLGLTGNYSENLIHRALPDDSAQSVFDEWFNSPSHRDAILDPSYILTGFGVCGKMENSVDDPYGGENYFVEHFYSKQISN